MTFSGILRELSLMKKKVITHSQLFIQSIKALETTISEAWIQVEPSVNDLTHASYILWLVGLSISFSVSFCILLYMFAFICDSCHWTDKFRLLLIISTIITSLFSVILAFFVIFQMLFGGHAYLFICRPAFETPNFSLLTKLVDNPGLLFASQLSGGFFGELFDFTGKENLPPIDVTISDVINNCQSGKPTYETFDLEKILNLSELLDYNFHPKLLHELDGIRAPETLFLSITHKLQYYLEDMIPHADMNLTMYRLSLVQMTPENDLLTFIDQMQRVSLQVSIHNF